MKNARWKSEVRIEDPRNHPCETVERLRTLLTDGSAVSEDPHRTDFYEVHDDAAVYYIYSSPISGKVYLLATWQKDALPVTA